MRRRAIGFAILVFCFFVRAEDKSWPLPSGPQADGPFRKVVLEADRDVDGDGKIDDVLVDPMELAIAQDGRVFYIERAGTIKLWKPASQCSATLGKLKVFTSLEDGLLGLALDPKFLQNQFIYLFYSESETHKDAGGQKVGTNRVSRFTLKGETLELD